MTQTLKIKSTKPTNNTEVFDLQVEKLSKELKGFATQTHFAIDSKGVFWYWATVFYKVD